MDKTLFIDTNGLPRVPTSHGEFTEVLNERLAGAKNVAAQLRWLRKGETFNAEAGAAHQLVYIMEGEGSITLADRTHAVGKGMGVYLGPSETATFQAAAQGALKLFQLLVPRLTA